MTHSMSRLVLAAVIAAAMVIASAGMGAADQTVYNFDPNNGDSNMGYNENSPWGVPLSTLPVYNGYHLPAVEGYMSSESQYNFIDDSVNPVNHDPTDGNGYYINTLSPDKGHWYWDGRWTGDPSGWLPGASDHVGNNGNLPSGTGAKVYIYAPWSGMAVVAVIGDNGPAPWTGRQFGVSNKVFESLGLPTSYRDFSRGNPNPGHAPDSNADPADYPVIKYDDNPYWVEVSWADQSLQPGPITSESSSGEDPRITNAIAWAENQIGSTEYYHHDMSWCQTFVGDAYRNAGSPPTTYLNAKAAADALDAKDSSGIPPRGAYVFYESGTLGHVGLSIGDGKIIHVSGAEPIRKDPYTNVMGLPYIGWAYPSVTPPLIIKSAWEFNTPHNKEGWLLHNINGWSVESDGKFRIDPAETDPWIELPSLSISANNYNAIQINMASNAPDGNGAIYFKTSADPEYSDTKKVIFSVNTDGNFRDYSIFMGQNPLWEDIITGIRIDPSNNGMSDNSDSIGFDFIRLTKISWEFNNPGDEEGWLPHNIDGRSVENDGIFRIDPAETDPWIESPTLAISADNYNAIQINMASNAPDGNGAIYFKTSEDPEYSDTKKVIFPVNNNGNFKDYKIIMNQNPIWTGTITGIRIDPCNGGMSDNSDSIGFDYIRFINFKEDSFGYTFIDSNTPEGPTYDWIEISGTGTEVLSNSDDSWVGGIDLGFFFNYYGTDYSQLAISNNGLLFSGGTTWQYVNQPITQTPGVHGFIAPFWDDIITYDSRGAGTIYYQTLGTAPNRKFVVEWYDNKHYSNSDSGVTFEAILYEGSNNILFQYNDVDFGNVYSAVGGDNPPYDNGGSATVGIEGPAGDDGLQYSFNEQVIDPGLAILFKFPQFAGTNLYLSKQAPASKDRGSTMTYTLHYHNFGDTSAQNVVLEDTLPAGVEFVSASDGGSYNSNTRKVTWNIGSVAPNGHGYETISVKIPQSAQIGTVIQNDASISTSNLEVRYDDNEAHARTTVTGSSLPPNVGVEPNNGGTGAPSIYWHNPITFSYHSSDTATGVDIRIHVNDGGPDITGSMTGGPSDWTYTTTFYPRHGRAAVTYTVNDPTPYSPDFDLQNMHGFENTITAAEIEDYIQNARNGAYRNSPMLQEAGIGERFVTAGRNNNVNPAFLVATAELEGRFGVWWDNDGDGDNDNWAYTHPEAHNPMGWGVPLGSTPVGPGNTFDGWGDCIEHVAQRIAAPNGYYYGSGLRTVHDIRGVYVGGPNAPNYASVPFLVSYMNNLARHAGQAGEFDEDFNIYIDPAGYIYDADTGERIEGATVWLRRPDGEGGYENVPTGEDPAISQPDENPLITGEDGQYQWDVLAGSYRVHVEASGYYPADSIVVSIPPPVTDLHVGLTRIPVENLRPVADAGGPYIGNVGEPIAFDGTGSYDLDGTIVSYEWDLDDDGMFDDATGSTPSLTWGTTYSGTISLLVTDDGGEINFDSTTLTVEEAVDTTPPTIESVTLDAYTTIPDATIHVTVEATDNIGVTSVTADGAPLDETGSIWEGDITAPSTTGDYTLTITAKDDADNVAETTVDYSVIIPTGGLGIAVLPKTSSATDGSTVPLDIKVVSTENFDDVVHVYLTLEGIPVAYQADLTWFSWTDKIVQIPAGGEIMLPVEEQIPVGESGLKYFYAKAESTNWNSDAKDWGRVHVTPP